MMKITLPSDLPVQVELLESLAFVAAEHESSLDLLALASYAELYARHLELAAPDARVPALGFEAFVVDAAALELAAREAQRVSGVPTRSPGPIGVCPVGRGDGAEPAASREVSVR